MSSAHQPVSQRTTFQGYSFSGNFLCTLANKYFILVHATRTPLYMICSDRLSLMLIVLNDRSELAPFPSAVMGFVLSRVKPCE